MRENFSRVIQGCMGWGAWGKKLSQKEMADLMHISIESGITTFDHADIYGDYTTEAEFGAALAISGIPREGIQLISKCGIQYIGNTRDNEVKHYQYDAEYIIWSTEKSIGDLNADYLDLLLLHRPSPLMRPDEVAKAVDMLKSQGKIKHFGVSNFLPPETNLIASKTPIEANQIEFSITAFDAMHDGTLSHMISNNIMPMCWSPLGSVFRESNEQTLRIHKQLEELKDKYNASHDQLLLAWIMKHPASIHPVVGTASPERIAAAGAATEIELSDVDWFKLLVASQGHKVP